MPLCGATKDENYSIFGLKLEIVVIIMIKTCASLVVTLLISAHPLYAGVLDDATIPFTRVDTTFHAETYPIAAPLSGGPLRLLFIGRHDGVGRACVEVASRLDSSIETLLTESRRHLGTVSLWKEFQPRVLTEPEISKRLSGLLHEEWDAFWLDYDIDALPV